MVSECDPIFGRNWMTGWLAGWLTGWYMRASDYQIRFLVSFVGWIVLSQRTDETNTTAVTIAIQIVNTHTSEMLYREKMASKCNPRKWDPQTTIYNIKLVLLPHTTMIQFWVTIHNRRQRVYSTAGADDDDVDDELLSAFIAILCIKWEIKV